VHGKVEFLLKWERESVVGEPECGVSGEYGTAKRLQWVWIGGSWMISVFLALPLLRNLTEGGETRISSYDECTYMDLDQFLPRCNEDEAAS